MESPTDENSRLSTEEDIRMELKEDEDDEEDEDMDDEEDDEEDDEDVEEEDEDVDEYLVSSVKDAPSVVPCESTVSSEPSHSPVVRKRGRPSKADILRRQSEVEESPPKRRGRKPLPKEERERLKVEKKEKKRLELIEKRKSGVGEGVAKKKPGRKSVVLSAEEKEKREMARRAKYEEFKKVKAEKAAKRAERNEQLRLIRKQKKEDEAKQREAYEKRMQELKASFLDENTQMSSGGAVGDFVGEFQDETSQSSFSSKKGFINEMSYIDRVRNVTAETLLEYRWPLEGKNSEYYFLQEQVCEYLGLKSFKRRYPDVARRKIDFEERDFLVEMKIVSEMQADLGLTAIPSSEVLDIMSRDFYEKYDEYMNVISERKDRNIRQMSYNTVTVEKHHLADFVERAVQSTAEWNKKMNKDRFENRKAYFDLQTFNIHYPMNNRGRMRVISKPKLGHYPIAIIPGQFTDYYRKYTPSQLKYMPLNSTLAGPPQSGTRIDCVDSPPELDVSESSDCSTCSDSSSSESEYEETQEKEEESPPPPSLKRNDVDKPGARCKDCQGDSLKNKIGIPEDLLHCSKCDLSAHPTCIGLSLEHVPYVTNYEWECTECKKCIKCKDHTDEEKMLFCDLCDRGFHIYCVGLDEVPIGRWHCSDCSFCFSCGAKEPNGGEPEISNPKWAVEYKPGGATRVFSHTLCSPCQKLTKKGQFCPECNKVFGREEYFSEKTPDESLQNLVSCWVCSRQHHAKCVSQSLFICSGCQRRTKEKSIGSDSYFQLPFSRMDWTDKSPKLKPSRPASTGSPTHHTCETCGKIYKNRASLYTHKHRDHGNGSRTPQLK